MDQRARCRHTPSGAAKQHTMAKAPLTRASRLHKATVGPRRPLARAILYSCGDVAADLRWTRSRHPPKHVLDFTSVTTDQTRLFSPSVHLHSLFQLFDPRFDLLHACSPPLALAHPLFSTIRSPRTSGTAPDRRSRDGTLLRTPPYYGDATQEETRQPGTHTGSARPTA